MYHITARSRNEKTGPIPVTTTTARSCPPACPFNNRNAGGCYAYGYYLSKHWDKVTSGERGTEFNTFINGIEAMPSGTFWRHNQAGDLPGIGNRINTSQLIKLVRANNKKRGFTYTHKPVLGTTKQAIKNRWAIQSANQNGFTINLSGNNPNHADELAELDIAPVVTVVPENFPESGYTPAGRKIIVCPAQTKDNVTCKTCKLCSVQNRPIIGFRAHGTNKKLAELTAVK